MMIQTLWLLLILNARVSLGAEATIYPVIVDADGNLRTENILLYRSHLVNERYLNVNLTLNDVNYTAVLELDAQFLAKNSLVHKISRADKLRYLSEAKYACHFGGRLKHHPNSYVAVSLCFGMNGYVTINGTLYLIEKLATEHEHELDDVRVAHSIRVFGSQSAAEPKFHTKTDDRLKRSISREITVDTLVVADKSMSDKYKNFDLENYILTIMNMVASLYRDSSLGSRINIVVVRLIILEDEPFSVKPNANYTLDSFCTYQNSINLPVEHPNHHDLAVLITAVDICASSDSPCDTLGLASVGSICDKYRSCNINEDSGLNLALTIAHEIGHNFNADHDSDKNGCASDAMPHLMNTHIKPLKSDFIWSECSRSKISKFLEGTNLTCLYDGENENLLHVNQPPLPGIFYDLDEQCKLAYGEQVNNCENTKDECSLLWCKAPGEATCKSKMEKVADGTLCKDKQNFWCLNGKCVPIEKLTPPVDGGWGEWNDWSNCSRECNGGVQFIERKCDNPPPSNNGRYCVGERRRYRICNTQSCNDTMSDINYKNQQCAKFNNVLVNNKTYQEWEYYYFEGSDNPCKMYCKPTNDIHFKYFGDFLDDGTPCSTRSNDRCISGVCTKVGCDWQLGSLTKEDSCGVCGGDDSTCNSYKGSVEIYSPKNGGYLPVLIIPKQAMSIRIMEFSSDGNFNYLALKNAQGKYYLNGNFSISSNGEHMINDFKFRYKLVKNEELIEMKGPTTIEIHLVLLQLHSKSRVEYEYTLPNGYETTRKMHYYWKLDTDWSACSKSCGKGLKKIAVLCYEASQGVVDDGYCNSNERPMDIVEPCNVIDCENYWWTGEWQDCSASCSNGGLGHRKRSVLCVRQRPNLVDDTNELIAVSDLQCDLNSRPIHIEKCEVDMKLCNLGNESFAYWITEDWNRNCLIDLCSTETRIVKCSDDNSICDVNIRPPSERKCVLPENVKCGKWKVDPWSECSKSCGEGTRTRTVKCVGGDLCSKLVEPHSIEICLNSPCSTQTTHLIAQETTSIAEPDNSEIIVEVEFNLSSKQEVTPDLNDTMTQITFINTQESTSTTITTSTTSTTTTTTTTTSTVSASTTTKGKIATRRPNVLEKSTKWSPKSPKVTKKATIKPKKISKHLKARVKTKKFVTRSHGGSSSITTTTFPVVFFNSTTSEWPLVYNVTTLAGFDDANYSTQFEYENTTMAPLEANVTLNTTDSQLNTTAPEFIYQSTIEDTSTTTESTTQQSTTQQSTTQQSTTQQSTTSLTSEESTVILTSETTSLSTPNAIYEAWTTDSRINRTPPVDKNLTDVNSTISPDKFLNSTTNEDNTTRIDEDDGEFVWKEGPFGPCSKLCGMGFRSRKVLCTSKLTHETVDSSNCKQQRPVAIEKCATVECKEWNVTEWGNCVPACGSGFQTREAFCDGDMELCDFDKYPITKRPCKSKPCYEWITNDWSECSVSCGMGFRTRRVYCFNHLNNKSSVFCDPNLKPKIIENCSILDTCPTTTISYNGYCSDKFTKSLCRKVLFANRCNETYFGTNCCKTCSKTNF